MIVRELEEIVRNTLYKGKIILILGARQVGKTTLLKKMFSQNQAGTLWLNGDEADVKELFSNTTSTQLKTLIGKNKLVVLDEAQRIENIGLSLKLIVDNVKDVQVVVTGSSALELANKLQEPLTGRKYEYFLFPVSFQEMVNHSSLLEEKRLLEHRLIFGYYPEVVSKAGEEKELLALLINSYLYKDLFMLEQIKKPVVLEKLLKALALQIGNEVSYQEIGQLIGSDNQTIERYIDLLEKAFIVFRLQALSRNVRNEIKKTRKVYFYDTGIRNAIIKNFSPLALRNDVGHLWENYLIVERMKQNHYLKRFVNQYFWRTKQQQEIDYIEEYDGRLHAYEFKWNPNKKVTFSKTFINAYPGSETKVITPENYVDFVTGETQEKYNLGVNK
jgi:predicted AAA+ superfamily ATPase